MSSELKSDVCYRGAIWWMKATEVTTGLAENNGSLPLGECLKVTCGLTACTPGSAPGPVLDNEYGRTLLFLQCYCVILMDVCNVRVIRLASQLIRDRLVRHRIAQTWHESSTLRSSMWMRTILKPWCTSVKLLQNGARNGAKMLLLTWYVREVCCFRFQPFCMVSSFQLGVFFTSVCDIRMRGGNVINCDRYDQLHECINESGCYTLCDFTFWVSSFAKSKDWAESLIRMLIFR